MGELMRFHACSLDDFMLAATMYSRSRKRFTRNSGWWRKMKLLLGEDYRAIRKQIRRQERWRRETLKRW